MGKYVIIYDTNILYMGCKDNDFNSFNFSNSLKNVIKSISDNNLKDKIDICIPEIVWLELKQHRREKIEEFLKKIKMLNENFSIDGVKIEIDNIDFNENSDILLDQRLKEYINQNLIIENIPIIFNNDSIVDRVVKKKPPFEGKNKESDKGFKDALLWESILNYKNDNKNKTIILYSNDKVFQDKYIINEYNNKFNEEIKIIDKEEIIVNYIESIKINNKEVVKQERNIYEFISNFILGNRQVESQYKYWMDEINAYGDGIKVISVENIKIINIIKNKPKKFITDSEYYVLINISSKLYHEEYGEIYFEPNVHFGVDVTDNNIILKIEGIEGRLV